MNPWGGAGRSGWRGARGNLSKTVRIRPAQNPAWHGQAALPFVSVACGAHEVRFRRAFQL